MHRTGYATMQRETISGRALEREVFTRITRRLEAAIGEDPVDTLALYIALQDNKQLWMTLAVDLANPNNHCPDQLKASLLSLAAFVEQHTRVVTDQNGSADILVEINQNIIRGLTAADMEAA
ncbi:flagellar biosynthesis regulator FlaF [Parvularcula sp. LCG005]|uniref:flagellar biosynthesis regulator FlaF n=1 Tax=Parvularcula sp. LCG005 TaxID=3078805 RepID=UPI00294347C2|nr:flagellar biosynthesis regulator FlaF [Parvularcula sp. LCG005]WOI52948.1 flagellar biosynthesis regulator FlaF [Parvularcula sp. LCG005]